MKENENLEEESAVPKKRKGKIENTKQKSIHSANQKAKEAEKKDDMSLLIESNTSRKRSQEIMMMIFQNENMKLKKWKINSIFLNEVSHRNIKVMIHLLPLALTILNIEAPYIIRSFAVAIIFKNDGFFLCTLLNIM